MIGAYSTNWNLLDRPLLTVVYGGCVGMEPTLSLGAQQEAGGTLQTQ